MTTSVRPEISKKSKWWISKHRYYELRHFSLQYRDWKDAYNDILLGGKSEIQGDKEWSDPTGTIVTKAERYLENCRLIEECAFLADEDIFDYLMLAVTEGKSYTYLSTVLEMPCSKEMFYDRYRKFYYILSCRRL